MSTLTKRERDGLEDVFLSIHSNADKYKKLKHYSSIMMQRGKEISRGTLFKRAKFGLRSSKLSLFLIKLGKKKKNLSK